MQLYTTQNKGEVLWLMEHGAFLTRIPVPADREFWAIHEELVLFGLNSEAIASVTEAVLGFLVVACTQVIRIDRFWIHKSRENHPETLLALKKFQLRELINGQDIRR